MASGHWSAGGCTVAGALVSAGVGAIAGALAGPLGGRLASSALGDLLPSFAAEGLVGAAAGAASGAAAGAAGYGAQCAQGGSCSWGGLGSAVASGAESGAVAGAAFGAAGGAARDVLGRAGAAGNEAPPEEGAARGCVTGGQSFTAGTLVLLASGKAAPISSLEKGDKVKAVDSKTGKPQLKQVAAVLVHYDTDLYDLTVGSGGHTEVIHTTSNHLFWDPSLDQWLPASNLKVGERLKTPGGQAAVVVGGSVPAVHDGWMWDLTVPGNNDHDFYVVISGDSTASLVGPVVAVLVHNCPMARNPSILSRLKLPKSFDGIDFNHIQDNHFPGGAGVTPGKDLWPAGTTNGQMDGIARQAFNNNPQIVGYDAQTGMMQAQARVGGPLYQFQIPRGGGMLRSIYPIG